MKLRGSVAVSGRPLSDERGKKQSTVVSLLINEFKDLSVDIFHDISDNGKFDSAKSYTMLKSRIHNQLKSGDLNPKDTLTLKSIQVVLTGLEKVKRGKVSTNIETLKDDTKRSSIYLEADAVNRSGDESSPHEVLTGMKKLILNLIGDQDDALESTEVIVIPDLIQLTSDRVTITAKSIIETLKTHEPVTDITVDNMIIYHKLLTKFILTVASETVVDTLDLVRVRNAQALAQEINEFLSLYMELSNDELETVEDKIDILTETEPRDSLELRALFNRLTGTVYTHKEGITVDQYSILDADILYGALAVLIGELTPDDYKDAIQKEVIHLEKIEDEEMLDLSIEISRLRLIEELTLEHDIDSKFEVTELLIDMLITKDTDTIEEQNASLNDSIREYIR